jgi:hypothetical protein
MLAGLALALAGHAAHADEGMWTYDAFPADRVRAAYGAAPDQAWLDRVRSLSVRLDGGCSASVVSRDGLVLTNHHCVLGCVNDLASAENDYVNDGFLAQSRPAEKQCPGAEASILQAISDVTDRVKAAAATADTAEAQARARRTESAAIERECTGDDVTRRCEVVSLYRGGQYKLYTYRRFQDVRLAFAPELQAGFFGGDPDNFNFPRYAFDMALVRLYHDGQPAKFDDALAFSGAGAEPGDLVFVSGHPGSTERLRTTAQLAFLRDTFLPFRLIYLSELRGALLQHGRTGEEPARRVADDVFGIENTFKNFVGRHRALTNAAFFGRIASAEADLQSRYRADTALAAIHGDPWAAIVSAEAANASAWLPTEMLETRAGGGSALVGYARTLLRGSVERAKPAAERLPEFAEARLPSLERRLMGETPVYTDVEAIKITFWLLKAREYLGADHPAVKAVFGNRTAEAIAEDIATNSRLADVTVRRALWEGGEAAVAASTDPAIAMARLIDSHAREARSRSERDVSGPTAQAAEKIAAIRFALDGANVYPDATFTLRLSFGQVAGWLDPVLGQTPAYTFTKGLWERATGAAPFNLASKWAQARERLNLETRFNLVSTNDIIGGNSGSPLVNLAGEIVGLVFDGNIHSLGGAYGFDGSLNRTVSVASPVMLEALRTVYGAGDLADELTVR